MRCGYEKPEKANVSSPFGVSRSRGRALVMTRIPIALRRGPSNVANIGKAI